MEIRPGFLAKWIEFIAHDVEEEDSVKMMRDRWENIKNNVNATVKS